MDKGQLKYPIGAFALSVAAKLIYFLGFPGNSDADLFARFSYMLFLLLALFLGVYFWKQDRPQSEFTDDVKTGMKITSIYAIFLSSFTYLYYRFIDPGYFAGRIQEAVNLAPEDQKEEVERTVSFIFDAFTHSTITLFGTIILGFFYVLVLVIFLRWQARQLSQR